MILSKCYKCCHEEICSYKEQFNNAVESVVDVSYPTGGGKYEFLKDSPITVEFKCPHYYLSSMYREKGGE